MLLTAQDFAQQMIAQARILDPNISLETGTPERKIVDTVAQALSENQVDLTGLESALDIDSKYGTSLDRFIALFGFPRQAAIAATGFVIFSRNTQAPTDVIVPLNTMVQSTQVGTSGQVVQYATTAGGVIPQGHFQSGPVPVQCIVPGTIGNVAANTITIIIGTNVPGITAVTNPNAVTSGVDQEDDDSLKVRFKNTWARNLAGTQAQYLALALTGTFTTKANVIGQQSRYQEYTQVPDWDDAGYLSQEIASGGSYGIADIPGVFSTQGIRDQWTTALSSIPYAKEFYTNAQVFVSNGQTGAAQFYYRKGVDFQFNYPPLVQGDTIRGIYQTITTAVDQTPDTADHVLEVQEVFGLPQSGTLIIVDHMGVVHRPTYAGVSAGDQSLTGLQAMGGATIAALTPVYIIPDLYGVIKPNFTILNVFNPSDEDTIPGLQAMAPKNVILTEFSYISSASRNTLNHNMVNAVDVFVNGANDVQTSCILLSNVRDSTFAVDPFSPWYYENYRREGRPAKRPHVGNYFMPLFQTPIDSIPDTITIDNQNYYRGFHYWLVQEISEIGGSIRARDGIEWNKNLGGDLGANPAPADPMNADAYLLPYNPPGDNIAALNGSTVEIDNYQFDANVATLQASMEAARQITTDVLAHRAKARYFKLDITVMYSPNSNFAVVNSAIGVAVQAFFDRQYFGTVIQLSDLLETIHEVPGVDNVRWSNDVLPLPDLIRVVETDRYGKPIHGVTVDRFGPRVQTLYIVGNSTGTFKLVWSGGTTGEINLTEPTTGAPVAVGTIQSTLPFGIVITEDSRPTHGVARPIRSFTMTYGSGGPGDTTELPSVIQNITMSNWAFDTDFFLLDDELPSLPDLAADEDTVPGLIIRPRAQTTFFRPGLG